jgi:hypothetical protein
MRTILVSLLVVQASALTVRDVNNLHRATSDAVNDAYNADQKINDLAQVALNQAVQEIHDDMGSLTSRVTSCNAKTLAVRREW